MSDARTEQQETVVDWFNAIYTRKGDAYLRPARAYTIFLELLEARPGERLLDVACGLGRLLEAARPYGVTMTGLDIAEVAVAAARQNLPEAQIDLGNAEALPYDDGSFDLVTCIGSLERVLNTEAALAEMRRVATPEARYCIMVRNADSAGWRLRNVLPFRRNAGHAGAHTLAAWAALFEGTGFSVRAVWPDQYPLQLRARLRSLFSRPVDARTPIKGTLDGANEFIFILGKAA